MVNINKLKGKIVEKGFTVSELADKIDLNKATLYRKINDNGENFTIKETEKIAIILNLTAKEINDIFFAQGVAQYAKDNKLKIKRR